MQTILGTGGSVGSLLAKELLNYDSKIRLVSRNPKKVNPNDETFSADFKSKEQTSKAIEGSDVVYLIVGIEYKYSIWKTDWPLIMQNVIDGCLKNNSKLVFLDNIYMLGVESLNNVKEDSKINPCSKKGSVRAELNQMIFDAIQKKGLQAIIARAGDFYGPPPNNSSILMLMVFNRMKDGKKAQWPVEVNKKHAFTYTPDIAKAMAKLGNTESAYNQVWNMPTDKNALTGKEWIELIANKLNKEPKFQLLPSLMFTLLSPFVSMIKEVREMNYQFTNEYIINSDKIEKELGIKPTKYEDGIDEIIKLG
ncbi:MAG: NAD-dependent dehydratase [Ignavibacteriae bacterium]|nr:NAD-dependent dehydratase [Ignavibacteriota bacterium]